MSKYCAVENQSPRSRYRAIVPENREPRRILMLQRTKAARRRAKIAVLAPMPIASERTAATVKPGSRRRHATRSEGPGACAWLLLDCRNIRPARAAPPTAPRREKDHAHADYLGEDPDAASRESGREDHRRVGADPAEHVSGVSRDQRLAGTTIAATRRIVNVAAGRGDMRHGAEQHAGADAEQPHSTNLVSDDRAWRATRRMIWVPASRPTPTMPLTNPNRPGSPSACRARRSRSAGRSSRSRTALAIAITKNRIAE